MMTLHLADCVCIYIYIYSMRSMLRLGTCPPDIEIRMQRGTREFAAGEHPSESDTEDSPASRQFA